MAINREEIRAFFKKSRAAALVLLARKRRQDA